MHPSHVEQDFNRLLGFTQDQTNHDGSTPPQPPYIDKSRALNEDIWNAQHISSEGHINNEAMV